MEQKRIWIKDGVVGCYRDTHCDSQKCCYSRDENCLCDRPECRKAQRLKERNSNYAPDKHGPKARKRKEESQLFIKKLMEKHGITEEELYRVNPKRNPYHSEMRKG